MIRRVALLLLLLLPLTAAAAQGTPATRSSPALAGHDSNAPIDVAADHGTLASKDQKAVLSGNVHVVQGDLTMDSDRVTITYTADSGTQIQRIDAAGGVTLRNPTETARSQFAIYDLDRKIVTMLGGVVLNRNGNEVRSQRLVYDLNSGRANVDSGAGGGGRVTGHFTVPQRQTNGAPSPAPVPPSK